MVYISISAHYKIKLANDNTHAHILLMSKPECLLCLQKNKMNEFALIFLVSDEYKKSD